MKTKFTILAVVVALLFSSYILKAQTNVFPATGNVGIGTAAPASKLDILPANGNAISIRPYGTAPNNTGQLQFKELAANGNNHIAFRAPDALASNYVFRLPINYGTNGQLLTTNGAGVLSWTTLTAGGGATTSLNNLITTSVNQNLVPSATDLKDLGTTSKGWRNIYATGSFFLDGVSFVNLTGTGNTFLGRTNNSNNTGLYNTFVGSSTGAFNGSGFQNTAVGAFALNDNSNGNYNTALGTEALQNNSNGSENTAVGNLVLTDNVSGFSNTSVGFLSFGNTVNSHNNTALGCRAGTNFDNGWNNIFVGANSDANSAGLFNVISIGQGATVYASSEALIGNTATATIGGYVDWSNYSDGRFKKDIKEDVKGLEFIMKLRPVTYHLDVTGLSEKANEGRGQQQCEQMKALIDQKEKIVQTGFIAQEVEAAAKELNYNFSGVDVPQNENDLYALRYATFVVPLVKAVQELNAELKMQNAELKNEIAQIKSVLTEDQQQRLSEIQKTKSTLEQNIPNPFNKSTVIKYYVPGNFNNAQLKIYSSQGVELKAYTIKQSGKGELTIEANTLAAGIYTYTLIVEGNAMDVKQMIVTK